MPMGMVRMRGQGFVVGRRKVLEVFRILDNY